MTAAAASVAILPIRARSSGVDRRRRRLLDQLLVAALQRAVALAEMDHVAVLVGEHLDLDVARVGQVALEVDGRVGEELLALARGPLERLLELVLAQRDPEALAAAAARGLDRDRVADRLGDQPRASSTVATGSVVPGTIGTPAACHQLARTGLRSHRLDRRGRRADERDPVLLERRGETGVLGQEAVARMDGLGAGALDRVEQPLDHEIALARRARAEQERLIGALDVRRVAVELRVDGDGRDPELLAGADDADRDLAAVGDQDLGEHGARRTLPAAAAGGRPPASPRPRRFISSYGLVALLFRPHERAPGGARSTTGRRRGRRRLRRDRLRPGLGTQSRIRPGTQADPRSVSDGRCGAVRYPLGVYLLSRVLYLAVAIADNGRAHEHVSMLSELLQWDGKWYVLMASDGGGRQPPRWAGSPTTS